MLLNYIKKGFEIAIFNEKTIQKVYKDKKATKYAIAFFILAVLVFLPLSLYLNKTKIVMFWMFLISEYIGIFAGYLSLHLIAKAFNGKGKFIELIRPMWLVSILCPISIAIGYLNTLSPFRIVSSIVILCLAFVWGITYISKVVRIVYKISPKKAVIAAILSYLIEFFVLFLMLIVFMVLITVVLALMGQTSTQIQTVILGK
jgi:hypothetical protein